MRLFLPTYEDGEIKQQIYCKDKECIIGRVAVLRQRKRFGEGVMSVLIDEIFTK